MHKSNTDTFACVECLLMKCKITFTGIKGVIKKDTNFKTTHPPPKKKRGEKIIRYEDVR